MVKYSLWIVFAASFMLGPWVHAQEEEVHKLETAINDAMKVMYGAKFANDTATEKAAAVRAILEQNYDLMVIIRRTMGRNWKLLMDCKDWRSQKSNMENCC